MEVVQQWHLIPVVILMPHVMMVPVSVMLTSMMMTSATIMLERVHYVSTNLT